MQETNFDFEIVIGEDCSTDGTGEICEELAGLHPDRIRLFRRSSNWGAHANFRSCYEACHGEYVAFPDGDDYWTDPRKLMRQVGVLDADASLSLAFHRVKCVSETSPGSGDVTSIQPTGDLPALLGIGYVLSGGLIPTGSVMIRRSVLPEIPQWIDDLPGGDSPVFFLAAQSGPLAFDTRTMAAYRVHRGGAFSGLAENERLSKSIDMWTALECRCDEVVRHVATARRRELLSAMLDRANRLQQRCEFLESKYPTSWSFKIGNALLTPFRALYSAFNRHS